MTRYLIVNADDYGLTPAVSAGIRRAHRDGLVTSTTAMLNMPAAPEAIRAALDECPNLGLGVHLVLTAGRPLLPPERLPRLMALSGDGRFPTLAAFMAAVRELDVQEVQAEWRAQIEAFVRAAGRAPTHLDSHHHTSYYTPALLSAMLALAQEFGCAIRNPLADPAHAQGLLGLPPDRALIEQTLAGLAPVLAAAPNVPRPDHFEPRFFGGTATPDVLDEILAGLPPGTTEIMCHPGLVDDELLAASNYTHPRETELAALTQPGLRQRLAEAGVALIHFGQLRGG